MQRALPAVMALVLLATRPAADAAVPAGSSLVAAAGPLVGVSVQALAVDPTNSQIVYAGTTNGVYKSTDGASSWTRVDSFLTYTNVIALAIDPNAPCSIFAGMQTGLFGGTQNTTAMLAASLDCGSTWGQVSGTALGRETRSLAFGAATPSVRYSAFVVNVLSNGFSLTQHRISRTVSGVTEFAFSFEDGNFIVASDPASACGAYAGAISGKVYQNTSCGTMNWSTLGTTLNGAVNALVAHPTIAGQLLAGTSAGSIYRKAGPMDAWSFVTTFPSAISSLVYHQGQSVTAYAASGANVYRSLDGGLSWHLTSSVGTTVAALAAGVLAKGPVYAGGATTVVKVPGRPAVDFDRDNNGDVFILNPSTGGWATQNATAGGGFTGATGAWTPGWTVTPATFNGDGRTDFFLFNPQNGQWFRMLSDGAGGFTSQGFGAWSTAWQRFVVDLDGDGLSDVFLWDPAIGEWFQCLSTSGGTFTYVHGFWSAGFEVYPTRFNLDAQQDFFLFNRASGQWFWVLGAAGGTFTYPQSAFWSTDWVLYPADYSGDGLDDVLLVRPTTGFWFVATTGTGFSYSSGFFTPGYSYYAGDLNADGRSDLFLHSPSTGQWFEMISTGGGAFTNAGGAAWSLGWSVTLTDFNGDDRSDVLLYNATTGMWFQARNATLGAFTYTNGFWDAGLTIVATGRSN